MDIQPRDGEGNVSSLPDDALRLIFNKIGVDDLVSCSRACKRWRKLLIQVRHVLSSPSISGISQSSLRLSLRPSDTPTAIEGLLSSLASLSLSGHGLAVTSLYVSFAAEPTLSSIPVPPSSLAASLSSLSRLCLHSSVLHAPSLLHLSHLPSLRSLVLHSSPLASPSCFSSLLPLAPSLQHLALRDCDLFCGLHDLRPPPREEAAAACLLSLAQLSSLLSLRLHNVRGLPLLALHPLSSLPHLSCLSLHGVAASAAEWKRLESCLLSLAPSLAPLRSLDICHRAPLSKPLLASLQHLRSLTHLAASCSSGYQLRCIAANLPSLASLCLQLCQVGPIYSAELRQAVRGLSSLRQLEVEAEAADAPLVLALVRDVAASARSLSSLTLRHCVKGVKGEELVREAAFLPSLSHLGLPFAHLPPPALARLSACRLLRSLDLRYANVESAHVAVLATLSSLTRLQLTCCNRDSIAAEAFRRLREMPRLQSLVLSPRQYSVGRTMLPLSVVHCDDACW